MKIHFSLLFLFIVFLQKEVNGQSVVSNSVCEAHGIHCPGYGDPIYKTFCCSTSTHKFSAPTCCNPYFDLYLGMGISVPLIVIVIAIIIVLYCCWWRYNRKRKRRIMDLLLASRTNSHVNEICLDAPPPYTPTDDKPENQLPQYTVEDPYSSVNMQQDDVETDQQRLIPPDYLNDIARV